MPRLLEDKVAIVTGSSQGLGLEIARKYLNAGASLAVCARDQERLGQVEIELGALLRPRQRTLVLPVDVSDAGQVLAFVDRAKRTFGRIDILVNNAGVYGPKGDVEEVDWESWVRTIEINLCGSVLMCRAVLPEMKRQRKGKIIQLSGGGATNPLPKLSAYAASKAAIVRFVETLAEELRTYNIDVNAIAPGALNTRMLDEVLEAGPAKVGSEFYERAVMQKQTGGTPLEKGAALAVFLASTASDGITGKLISASWDPWPTLPTHLDELRRSDIYTLRRIVPKDRGKLWGDGQ